MPELQIRCQISVMCFKPCSYEMIKLFSKDKHLLGLMVGHRACPVITGKVSPLSECIKTHDERPLGFDGKGQGLNDPIMMGLTIDDVSRLHATIHMSPEEFQARFAGVKGGELPGAPMRNDEPTLSIPG